MVTRCALARQEYLGRTPCYSMQGNFIRRREVFPSYQSIQHNTTVESGVVEAPSENTGDQDTDAAENKYV